MMARRKPTWEMVEIPEEFAYLADRRTRDFLHPFIYTDLDFKFLLRSCYLQGCWDMAEALRRRNDG